MPRPIEFEGAGAMEVVWGDMSILRLWYEGIDGEPGLLGFRKGASADIIRRVPRPRPWNTRVYTERKTWSNMVPTE
jgi:hypothetical protein